LNYNVAYVCLAAEISEMGVPVPAECWAEGRNTAGVGEIHQHCGNGIWVPLP